MARKHFNLISLENRRTISGVIMWRKIVSGDLQVPEVTTQKIFFDALIFQSYFFSF